MSLRNALRRWAHSGSSTSDGENWARRRLARRSSGIERALWLVVVLGMAADVVLTHVGLQIGLVELNPIARGVLHTQGVLGLVGLKVVALGVGASLWFVMPRRYTIFVPLGLALPTIPAVVSNVALISVTVS